MRHRAGLGKRSTSFATMATAEPNCTDQVLIGCESTWGEQHLIASSSLPRDRLARNYVHQMLLIEEFERGGCQVEFVDRPMSHDPHDQLLLQIRGAVSEYERSLIAERMRRGRRQKYLAGGLLPWTRAPYGYRVDPARPRDPAGVRLEPAEAAVVAELFASYLQEGSSLKGQTQRLTSLGVCQSSGKNPLESGDRSRDTHQSCLHGNRLHRAQSSDGGAWTALRPGSRWSRSGRTCSDQPARVDCRDAGSSDYQPGAI